MSYFKLFISFVIVIHSLTAKGQIPDVESEYTYCIHPNRMPYEAIVDGKHVGISKEYLNYFNVSTGIKFTLVRTDSWTQTLEFVRSGKCDVVPMLNPSPLRSTYLDFTNHYFESPNVILTRIGADRVPGLSAIGSRVVGVVKNYRSTEYVFRFYPHLNYYELSSEAEGMRLLSKGKIDVMLGSLLSSSRLKNELNIHNVIISGYGETQNSLTMGVVHSRASLIDIINDSITNIPEDKVANIYKRWYHVTPISKSFNDWLYPVLISLFVTLGATFWIRISQRKTQMELNSKDNELDKLQSMLIDKNRTVEFLSVQDEFTKLNNRNYMLKKADEEISRFHRFHSPVTLILVHLAKNQGNTVASQDSETSSFKHQILHLAEIVIQKTRDVDITSRWSNDEVLILCPQTSLISAQILAERILTEIELQSLRQFNGVKVSIGLSTLKEEEDFSIWFDKAAASLRIAKKQARHSFEVSSY